MRSDLRDPLRALRSAPRMASLNKKFPRLLPAPIRKGMRVDELIDTAFKAYNGARLAEACRLFTTKMIAADGTVGIRKLAGDS